MNEKYIKHCCYCDLIEYEGVYMDKKTYHEIVKNPAYTSGINPEHPMCVLLAGLSCSDNDTELESIVKDLEEYQPDFKIK